MFKNEKFFNMALIRFVSLVFIIYLGSTVCVADSDSSTGPDVTYEARPVTLDLTVLFPVAEVSGPLTRIPLEEEYLTAGWNEVETSDTGEKSVWTRTSSAIIEIPIAQPSPMRVHLNLSPFEYTDEIKKLSGFREQSVRIFWNGKRIKNYRLKAGKNPIDFEVPETIQYVGPNRLELQPDYTVKLLGLDRGVKCSDLRIVRGRPATAGSRPVVTAADQKILQDPGSTFTYYFPIPKSARLRGEGRLPESEKEPRGKVSSRVLVTVLDAAGKEKQVFSRELDSLTEDGSFTLDIDLSDFSDTMAGVTFSLLQTPAAGSSPDTQSPIQIEWSNLRIEGEQDQLVATGLEELRKHYNVLVVLFDSLRADHTGPYGSPDVPTVAMDNLAAHGTTFQNAYSNNSWTRASVTSILTGLYPSRHNVVTSGDVLPADMPYLPEILQSNGYRTMAVIRNVMVGKSFGFDRGYDVMHEAFRDNAKISILKTPEKRLDYIWDNYVGPFIDTDSDEPFFLYMHQIDPHYPYAPHPPFDTLFHTGYRARPQMHYFDVQMIEEGYSELSRAAIKYLDSQYKGEIVFMDRFLGGLMRRLEQNGLDKNTLVVFMSDHGDEFMEHGQIGHGVTLWDEVLEVPLIFHLPGIFPPDQKQQYHAQLNDVTPTILDVLGIAPPPGVQGMSLWPHALVQENSPNDRATFSRKWRTGMPMQWDSVRYGQWKLIKKSAPGIEMRRHYPGAYEHLLFDMETDPEETINRWQGEMIVGKTLLQMLRWRLYLDEVLQGQAPNSILLDTLDEEALENMKALGYL